MMMMTETNLAMNLTLARLTPDNYSNPSNTIEIAIGNWVQYLPPFALPHISEFGEYTGKL